MSMRSKWRKAKQALGINSCLYIPKTSDENVSLAAAENSSRQSDVVSQNQTTSLSPPDQLVPTTPTPSSSGLLTRSATKSSKKTCAICLATMKPGQGHAIFTAECSHSFHFNCITSNVKHGNQICPVCRAKWREIPFQSPSSSLIAGPPRLSGAAWPQDDPWMTVLRRLPSPRTESTRQVASLYHASEPRIFDDDELLEQQPEMNTTALNPDTADSNNRIQAVEVKTYPEVSAVPRSTSRDDFTVLIHLKAPFIARRESGDAASDSPRAPVDLVTVLDVSGSMAGTKLALLKRAMGFVVQNLGPSDRLSVIAFSSTARRLFPLRRMTETGRQQALQAVNSLISNGGTNIAEGLRKGAKVLDDRKWKNPVCSIILLSDGQDTYTVAAPGGAHNAQGANYQSLLPISIHRNNGMGLQIPVHAFGFGADHDASSMHSISENSGGTFSFIEAESVIQDAFAQCIGGLLSVVVQELEVRVDSVHPSSHLSSIKAGSYPTTTMPGMRSGSIRVGDLYAEEERDFLVTVNVPADGSTTTETSLLTVRCVFRDPINKEVVTQGFTEVRIARPEALAGREAVSIEVDRQRNRVRAAEVMAEAKAAAESGDLAGAVSILESCRRTLSESVSAQNGDRLCTALCAELKEMQDRMANRRVYEESGRAYVLSGLSSHSWQRATARGNSTDSTSLVQSYQTPSMVDMVTRSQTMVFGNPSRRSLQQAQSFPARVRPR